MKGKVRHTSPVLLPAVALIAGLVNGFLGTGGGMILVLALSAVYPDDRRGVMATSTACVLIFSILSMILYGIVGHFDGAALLPVLFPALLGGALGSLLLGRLRTVALDTLLSFLLILSGLLLIV